jgi:hypothetical protein
MHFEAVACNYLIIAGKRYITAGIPMKAETMMVWST